MTRQYGVYIKESRGRISWPTERLRWCVDLLAPKYTGKLFRGSKSNAMRLRRAFELWNPATTYIVKIIPKGMK